MFAPVLEAEPDLLVEDADTDTAGEVGASLAELLFGKIVVAPAAQPVEKMGQEIPSFVY